jgi:dTMP kinase
MTKRRGLFLTFEGPDGSGKSTQAARLAARLRHVGYKVVESVEPGGTEIGKQIRRILLDPANHDLCPTAEMLLMFAARAQNVDRLILPALREGAIVISDRFTDSTLAYQGAARGLGAEVVLEVDRIACRGLVPDLTLCVDVDVETGLHRAQARNRAGKKDESRLDDHAAEFHRKVRAAYHQIAAEEPTRVRLVDGTPGADEVSAQVWTIVQEFLASRPFPPPQRG